VEREWNNSATGAFTDLVATPPTGRHGCVPQQRLSKPSRPGQQASSCSNTFPPAVMNKPPVPWSRQLFQSAFQRCEPMKDPAGYNPSVTNRINGGPVPTPITRGLNGVAGGVPLYKKAGWSVELAWPGMATPRRYHPAIIANPDKDEDVALAGQLALLLRDPSWLQCHDRRRSAALCLQVHEPAHAAPLGSIGVNYSRLSTQRRAGANHLSTLSSRRNRATKASDRG